LTFQVRDLVVTKDEFGARTFAIISITENGYNAVAIKSKKRYKLVDEQIACKIGEISKDSVLLIEDKYDVLKGQQHCLHQAREFPSEAIKWRALAKLTTDETICLSHRRLIFKDAVFLGINFTKPLYPIRARIMGKVHDFKLSALILSS
jgi:hypothetical protein